MAHQCATCSREISDIEVRMGLTRCYACEAGTTKDLAPAPRLEAPNFPDIRSQMPHPNDAFGSEYEAVGQVERDSSGDFLVSALASAIGGGATWATFAATDPGGTFYVVWGPTVFGAWKLLQGIVRFIRQPTGLGLGTGILALLILAAAGLALAVAVSQSDFDDNNTASQSDSPRIGIPDIPPGQTDIFDLEVGDCFSGQSFEGELASVTIVPCNNLEAAYRVTRQFDVPRDGSYPGISYFERQVDSRCPVADDWYFHPTEDSWSRADREITCLRSLD